MQAVFPESPDSDMSWSMRFTPRGIDEWGVPMAAAFSIGWGVTGVWGRVDAWPADDPTHGQRTGLGALTGRVNISWAEESFFPLQALANLTLDKFDGPHLRPLL